MSPYNKHRPESIQSMFGSIANSYDKTNAILSFQLHRLWNRKLINKTIQPKPLTGKQTLADLCCGTGAISLPWLASQASPQKAYLIDFCPEMIDCAKNKAANLQLDKRHEINYITADVQDIPLEEASVEYATIAYGIRNVNSPAKCFKEVYRILKNGGSFGILELTEPQNKLLCLGHNFYLKTALPLIGKLFTKNGDAYKYLSKSIQTFVKPLELRCLLEQSGFRSIEIHPLSFGIATLIIGKK